MKFPEMSEAWLRKVADAEPGGLMACSPEIYLGVTDAVDALFELRENGYHFVPPVNLEAK